MANNALKGLHVAVTRPSEQAAELCLALADQGASAIAFPLLGIAPLDDYSAFDSAITPLEQADWAIFISSNAVDQAMPRVIKKFGLVPQTIAIRCHRPANG